MIRYLLAIFLGFTCFILPAQFAHYDAQLIKVEANTTLDKIHRKSIVDVNKVEYTVNSRDVIEFYDSSDDLVGVYFDDTHIEIEQLRWVENNNYIQKLLDKYTTEYALAKYFDIPRNGMTKDDVYDLFGEAQEVKFSIDGYDQIITCTIKEFKVIFRNDIVERISKVNT